MTIPHPNRSVDRNRNQFPATLWTQIENPESRELIKGELYQQYYTPLYTYCRRKGFGHDHAEEYVQGFLADILIGRDFLSQADRTRGKLRSLLMKSLSHYIYGILRKKEVQTCSSEDITEWDIPEETPMEPEAAFDYTWASAILERILNDLEFECKRDGQEQHWALFEARVLIPILENVKPESLDVLCAKLHLEANQKASNMIVTVKRRAEKIFKRYLQETETEDMPFQEVLSDFLTIFAKA